MRADRLLSILLLLQSHRRLTAGDLARRLEVSERTIYRDMDALSAAGVPVTTERGAGGGLLLAEGYRTNLTGLNEAELRALFVGGSPRLFADLGLGQAAEAAATKLLAALPASSRRGAAGMRGRIHIDAAGWNRPEEAVPHLPALQDALWAERKVRLRYGRADGTEAERTTDPLGLVAKGSVWYLVAAVGGETRTYRVSRVREAEMTDVPCDRPEGFDLAAFWAANMRDFRAALPRYHTTVRVSPVVLARLRGTGFAARIEEEGAPDAEGWRTLALRFDVEWEAAQFALGHGPDAEVIAPPALRALVRRRARETAARYTGSDTAP